MEQMEFFISELSLVKCGYLGAIGKSDEALNELFNEAQKMDKVPNLRLYVNDKETKAIEEAQRELDQNRKKDEEPKIIQKFNNDENYIGAYSKEYEKIFRELSSEYFKNFHNLDEKYHYWNVGATPTVKYLAELELLVSELEKDDVIKSKYFNRDARFKLISDIYLKLPLHTRKAVFADISNFRLIENVERMVSKSMGLKEKDVSSRTELRISLINHLSALDTASGESSERKYNFDGGVLANVYEYCTNAKPIFTNSYSEFIQAVETANFGILKPTYRNKGKLRNLIYLLKSKYMNENWYSDVVKSLGITKSDCKNDSGEWYAGLEDYTKRTKSK